MSSLVWTRPTLKTSIMAVDIGGMRIKYRTNKEAFTESDLVAKEPITQFKSWFDEACSIPEIEEPNAMCLSTATKDGDPSGRMVLLKGYGKDGFKFFTNYHSRKGVELMENPRAALTFYWQPLKRSVRVEGVVEKLSEVESESYFHSRPRESQIGACVSEQSSTVPGRDALLAKERELTERHSDGSVIPRPKNWGGFKVIPHAVEFWQGQTNRIHDRIRFRPQKIGENPDGIVVHEGEDGWVYERLAP